MKKRLRKSINPNTKEFWEQTYQHHIHEKKLRFDASGLLKLMHLFEPAESILDFGSGLGGTVHFLASRTENKNYTLVDHSEVSMQYAKDEVLGSEDARGNSFFFFTDLGEIQKESVDLVISSQVLEHITEYKDMMDQLWSVIKPGGVFLISVPVRGIRDTNRQHVNKFTVNSMFRIMTKYDELVHILPRSQSKRSGKPTTAYFYVTKP